MNNNIMPNEQQYWYQLKDTLRWLLGFSKLRSSKNDEILQVVLELCHEKTFFSWRKETTFFSLFSL